MLGGVKQVFKPRLIEGGLNALNVGRWMLGDVPASTSAGASTSQCPERRAMDAGNTRKKDSTPEVGVSMP